MIALLVRSYIKYFLFLLFPSQEDSLEQIERGEKHVGIVRSEDKVLNSPVDEREHKWTNNVCRIARKF